MFRRDGFPSRLFRLETKMKYEKPEMEMVEFVNLDIITASGLDGDYVGEGETGGF